MGALEEVVDIWHLLRDSARAQTLSYKVSTTLQWCRFARGGKQQIVLLIDGWLVLCRRNSQSIDHFLYSSNQVFCTLETHCQNQGAKCKCICSHVCKHTVLVHLMYTKELNTGAWLLWLPIPAFFQPKTPPSPAIKGSVDSGGVQNYTNDLTAGSSHVRNAENQRNRNDQKRHTASLSMVTRQACTFIF